MIDKSFKAVFCAFENFCNEQESCKVCPLCLHCAIGGIEDQGDFEDSDLDYIMQFLYDHGYLDEGR